MNYRGWEITLVVDIKERQGLDDEGNVVSFEDAWPTSGGVYQAHRYRTDDVLEAHRLEDLKAMIDTVGSKQ